MDPLALTSDIRRDSPTPLTDVYVPPNFKIDRNTLSAQELTELIGANLQRTVVTGLAGSGKSVFLKYLFRKSIEDGYTYYPIFFELRSLNSVNKKSLKEQIFESVQNYATGFTKQQFEFGLRRGSFYLIIDALDETSIDLKSEISDEICDISRKYPKCPVVLTSRPSEEFYAWEGFTTAHLLPFNKTQCLEYIGKIHFDDIKKTEFLEALRESLFEEHEEFVSNPLLAAMMLLTYDEYGEIPARRHVFFEKCFQVLLREHDVSKSRYRRQFHSGMDYAELETALRHFCVLSYLDRKFSFKHEEILNTIGDALADLGFEVDPNNLLQDLTKSISILQKDGDYFEFVHRSFQEYFYAKFVVSDREFTLEEKLKEFLKVDDVIDMVIDMDRGYFETSFLLPRVRKLNRQFAKIDPEQKPDLIMNKFFANSSCGKKQRHDEDDLPPFYVTYSVSHEEREYEPRGLNLQVYWYLLKNHSDLRPHSYKEDTPNKEVILDIFNTTEQNAGSPRTNIPLRAHNRNKLIQLGAGKFAKRVKDSLAELEVRLERTTSKRSSSLSGKLRAHR
ncbi:NACHT domain-containing protein [Pacificibacter marinus]|uniref:NACHT domain protein n=1 Tax=Pacificibacter marinus TaxID=658057 RepID=A0A1Y5TXE5_9RHOB|nr:NACHT domain-containing protein [Pacificibacter marinus]SLN70654.1 NACHT domain protein [Pacificibacter marinus]